MPEEPDFSALAMGIMPPTLAMGELLFALIGHLHGRQLIDAQAIVALLQKRLDGLAQVPGNESLCKLLVGQIDWLDRIGTGLKSGERA